MQKITRTEITWIVNELLEKAIYLDQIIERGEGNEIYELQSVNLRSLAERLSRAALKGDKRIEIKQR